MIIGSPGAGKTQLSFKLSSQLRLPLYHLDRLFWKKGWIPNEHQEFADQQLQIISKQRWIMDGNYISTMDLRLQQADTIIFLDLPTISCLWGILKRYLRYRKATRPDMTEENDERLNIEFIKYVLTFQARFRPRIIKKLEALDSSKNIYILRSRKQADDFFNTLSSSATTE